MSVWMMSDKALVSVQGVSTNHKSSIPMSMVLRSILVIDYSPVGSTVSVRHDKVHRVRVSNSKVTGRGCLAKS